MAIEQMNVGQIWRGVRRFETSAHRIFGESEAAPSRVIQLKESYQKLGQLSVKQDDMLRQSLRCVELGVFRAAHVLAWAALVDYLYDHAAKDNLSALKSARPKWKLDSVEELREGYTEYHVIDPMRAAGLITKGEQKAFHGLLSRRNECAHPSDYYPDLNQSLGYVAEIINRLASHKSRVERHEGYD